MVEKLVSKDLGGGLLAEEIVRVEVEAGMNDRGRAERRPEGARGAGPDHERDSLNRL